MSAELRALPEARFLVWSAIPALFIRALGRLICVNIRERCVGIREGWLPRRCWIGIIEILKPVLIRPVVLKRLHITGVIATGLWRRAG